MDVPAPWLMWLVIAYLSGSIPFGLFIGWLRGVDLRAVGSGNLGATNVGRVLGKKWGLTCFGLDVAKGLLPVLGAGLVGGLAGEGATAALMWLAVAAAAILGHVFPVWLKFKGGKGVATGLGALLGIWPMLTLPAVVALLVWLAAVAKTQYVSVASMLAAMLLPLLALLSGLMLQRPADEVATYVIVTGVLGTLVLLRHRTNIERLRLGTEPKVGWVRR